MRFRSRVEVDFTRVERVRDLATGEMHWRTRSPENVVSRYGVDAATRASDPADPSRVATWLLAEAADDRGNLIRCDYEADAAARHLKRVRYANRRPASPATGASRSSPDYGEHGAARGRLESSYV
ncbi:SpvB/TcaC N-terminal domain-containing protein [Dactylosporangium sp. NPDC000521]|uniref:SpvB/TcaC N-terminal domain-containing protein n=1 Tax=Dactylosporangium sp. NPDC000521 TaxID=3363975 RepID=UPI0036ADE7AB